MAQVDIRAALHGFKERDATRTICDIAAPLLDDRDLVVLILNWPSIRCVQDLDGSLELEGVADAWEAIWEGSAVDYDQATTILGGDMQEAILTIERARALRLIYPDNTVDPFARKIARDIVRRQLGARLFGDESKDE